MSAMVRLQLWVMMFLQFFVWGVWAVTLGTYLTKIGFSGSQVGSTYGTMNLGAMVAPFFVGMVADRFFNAERVLGVLHLLGAVLLYYVSGITEAGPFFWAMLGYALCYMPTLALVNAISFHQMRDPSREFPGIRVLGTIGWIVAGLTITAIGVATKSSIEPTAVPLKIAAGVSLLLGVYSFTLPATPPKSAGKRVTARDVLGLDALALLRNPSFAVFFISSVLICIPLAFYYNFTNPFLNEIGVSNAAGKQTMGQMSEIFFLIVMPFFYARLGVKKMLLIGMVAWAVRYVLFAFGDAGNMVALLYVGILLHGICFDFFFVTGQLYVDREAPVEIRANAQGLIGVATYGLGMFLGSRLSGYVVEMYTSGAGETATHAWRSIWLVPAGMAAVILVAFAVLFVERPREQQAR